MKVEVTYKNVRRLSLRVRRDRTVALTVPFGVPEKVWRAFLRDREGWIEKALAAMPEAMEYSYKDGEIHWLLGRKVQLHVREGNHNGCVIDGDDAWMTVCGFEPDRRRILARAWAEELCAVVEELLPEWEERMHVEAGRITIKHLVSRWGSCNVRTGDISLSLDLSAKPVACIESVLVHELNHLIEIPHSPRFHRLMDHWLPDWRERKKRLNSFPREF